MYLYLYLYTYLYIYINVYGVFCVRDDHQQQIHGRSGLTKQIICARTNDDLFNFAAGIKADDRRRRIYILYYILYIYLSGKKRMIGPSGSWGARGEKAEELRE